MENTDTKQDQLLKSSPSGEYNTDKLVVNDTIIVTPKQFSPNDGDTIQLEKSVNILTPSADLPTLTIAFPLGAANGQKLSVISTQGVTSLTVSDGTISGGAPVALTANTALKYVFYDGTWYTD